MQIILGSSSSFRQQTLREMGYTFEIVKPDIDEKAIRDEDPEKLVLAIAHAKAEAIKAKIQTPAIIITADQVVTFKGKIREKPESEEEAKEFLKSYGEEPSVAVNGVVVTNTMNGKQAHAIDKSELYLHPLPITVIDQLIAEGTIMKCAGALRSEDPLMIPYIKEMSGTQDSFMGLPIAVTKRLIEEVS